MRNAMISAVALAALAGTGLSHRIAKPPAHPGIAAEIHQNLQGNCIIEGRVINADGDVVSGATVYADLDSAGSIQTDVSDKNGNFKIAIRQMGNYTVYGSKEEEGYPLTVSGFHQQVTLDQIPKLTIASCPNVTIVVLQLGRKAAMIEGDVRDLVTHQLVERATIRLRRVENPASLYQTETHAPGKLRVAVPTVPFTIEVESPRYENWSSNNDGIDGSDRLMVPRGQTKKLQIALRPKKDR